MKPSFLKEQEHRLELYETHLNLYNSKAFKVWGLSQRDYFKFFHKNNELSYINYNIFKLYCERMTDLVLSKGIYITTENEKVTEWLNEWMNKNDYLNLQEKKLNFGMLFGDSPVKIYSKPNKYSKDGKEYTVCVEYINPDKFYIITNKYNVNSIEGFALLHKFKEEDLGNIKPIYLLEEHYPGYIVFSAFSEKATDEWEQIDIQTYFSDLFANTEYKTEGLYYIQETSTTYETLQRFGNERDFDTPYSISDFNTAVKSFNYNINDTFTGIHSTNGMTRDPLYSVPNGTIKQMVDSRRQSKRKKTDGSIKSVNPYQDVARDMDIGRNENEISNLEMLYAREFLSELIYKSRALEKSADGQTIDVVEHNPQMENSFNELDKLFVAMFQLLSVSPVLIDPELKVGAISGVAIRNLAIATLKKASRKAKNLIRSIQKELYTVQELAIASNITVPFTEAVEVQVEIMDGLGTEPQDDIVWLSVAIDKGLINKEDAIAILRDLPADKAKEKAKELEEEAKKNMLENQKVLQNQNQNQNDIVFDKQDQNNSQE